MDELEQLIFSDVVKSIWVNNVMHSLFYPTSVWAENIFFFLQLKVMIKLFHLSTNFFSFGVYKKKTCIRETLNVHGQRTKIQSCLFIDFWETKIRNGVSPRYLKKYKVFSMFSPKIPLFKTIHIPYLNGLNGTPIFFFLSN